MTKAFTLSLPQWETTVELSIEPPSFNEEIEYHWEIQANLDQPDYSELNAEKPLDYDVEDETAECFAFALDITFQSSEELLATVRDKSPVATIPLKTALRTGCTAHTLQLVIKDGLKALADNSVTNSTKVVIVKMKLI